jgi:hypothetical protein
MPRSAAQRDQSEGGPGSLRSQLHILDVRYIQPYNSYASTGSRAEDGCDHQAVENRRSFTTVGYIVGYRLEFIEKTGDIEKIRPPYVGA